MPSATWNTSLTGKMSDSIFIMMHISTWKKERKERKKLYDLEREIAVSLDWHKNTVCT